MSQRFLRFFVYPMDSTDSNRLRATTAAIDYVNIFRSVITTEIETRSLVERFVAICPRCNFLD